MRKIMSNVRKFGKYVEKTRTIPFVFSDETKDSYGTVFTADGWLLDRFDKNGIALFNHNSYSSDPNMAIGPARAWVEDKSLVGEITFEKKEINPLAETIFRKFLNGTYKGVSIRYFPIENGKWGGGNESVEGDDPTYYIGKRELLEISVVPIPSNKNALVRSHGLETSVELSDGEGFYTDGLVRFCQDGDTEGDNQKEGQNRNSEEGENILDKQDDTFVRSMIQGYEAICRN